MNKLYTTSLLSALVIGCSSFAQTYSLNVPVVKQEQTNWCWAADTKCVLQHYGITKTQCSIVQQAYGSTCCSSPSSGTCNKTNQLTGTTGVKGLLTTFGQLSSVVTSGSIGVTKIVAELQAQRPFVIGIFWTGGGGHVVVGCGYNQTTGSITMMDSWQNNGMTTKSYSSGSSISTNSGSGTWAETLVLTTNPSTGIKNIDNTSAINIFPNPSNGSVTVQSSEMIRTVNVYNSMGQLVHSKNAITDKSVSININVSGLYSIQTVTENGVSNKMVIVK